MSQFAFFTNHQAFSEIRPKKQLNSAIFLIEQNKSNVAQSVMKAIQSGKIIIRPFKELSKKHYKSIKEDWDDSLPNTFPPSKSTIKRIEEKFAGLTFDDKYVYFKSSETIEEIASTLVHEVCHSLNKNLFNAELKQDNKNHVGYRDEVRSFLAETIFNKNGRYLLRSDVKLIHDKVKELYPDYSKGNKYTSGYLYSSYDHPLGEPNPIWKPGA